MTAIDEDDVDRKQPVEADLEVGACFSTFMKVDVVE